MGNEYRMNVQVDWMETAFQRSRIGATDEDVLTLYVSTTRDENKLAVGPVAIGKFVSGSAGDLPQPVKTPDFTVTDSDSIFIWCAIDNKASTGVEKAITDGIKIAADVTAALAAGEALYAQILKMAKIPGIDWREKDAAVGAVVAALLTFGSDVIAPVLEGLGLTDPDCDGPVFRPQDALIVPVGDLARKLSRSNLGRIATGISMPIGLWTDTSQTSPSACGHSPETTIRVSGAFTWQKNPTIVPGSKVAALSSQPGGTSLYALATDGHVWSKYFPDRSNPPAWSEWFRLGDKMFPTLQGATLAALTTGPGESILFVTDEGGQVWSNYFPDKHGSLNWTDWFTLGPRASASLWSLTAISANPGASSLYALDDARQLWTDFFPNASGAWSDWFTIAGGPSPALNFLTGLSTQPNQTSLFAVDGALTQVWARTFPDPNGDVRWSDWFSLGGLPNMARVLTVTALSTYPGATSLYAIADDGQLWSRYSPPKGPWSDWFPLGGQFLLDSAPVAALSTQPGGTSLFGLFGDGKLWTKFFPDSNKGGQWSDWLPLTAVTNPDFSIEANVSTLSTRPGEASLYAVDRDGQLWSRFFPDDNGQWSDWFRL